MHRRCRYSLRPNVILDAAFDHGFTLASTQWEGVFGLTYLWPHRLWSDRHCIRVPLALIATAIRADK
jgi:hypothetical protein